MEDIRSASHSQCAITHCLENPECASGLNSQSGVAIPAREPIALRVPTHRHGLDSRAELPYIMVQPEEHGPRLIEEIRQLVAATMERISFHETRTSDQKILTHLHEVLKMQHALLERFEKT